MTPEFRLRELDVGDLGHVIACLKCCSDYRVAARNECGCREANAKIGQLADFERLVGERE